MKIWPKSLTLMQFLMVTLALLFIIGPAWADDEDKADEAEQSEQGDADVAELAKKLSNPIASMISVPIQFNYDQDIGLDDQGSKLVTNIQPVIPMGLTEDWNLITRTILPVVSQWDVPQGNDTFGLGDVLISLWFSPKKPTSGGLVWGVGPALLFPTATDDLLGGKKWAAGPTIIGLKMSGPLTFGLLSNHIWSYSGSDSRDDISSTFVQPFFAYTSPTAFGVNLNTESTYNWETGEWSVPLNFMASQLVKVGKLPVSFQAGVRYWADSPETGPEGWGFRAAVTMIFPK